MYPCEANSCFPFTFTSGAPPGASQATEMAISEPFQNRCFNYGDSELPFAIKDRPDPAWVNHPDIATINKPPSATTSQEGLPSTNGICKSLLRLKMGLVEDLELFETGSMLLESSSIFYGSSNLSIETLDLPIYRLLNHSSWLLEIVRSSCGTEESLDVTSTQHNDLDRRAADTTTLCLSSQTLAIAWMKMLPQYPRMIPDIIPQRHLRMERQLPQSRNVI